MLRNEVEIRVIIKIQNLCEHTESVYDSEGIIISRKKWQALLRLQDKAIELIESGVG